MDYTPLPSAVAPVVVDDLMLSLGATPADFDFGAFFEDDFDYMGGEAYGSVPTSAPNGGLVQTMAPQGALAATAASSSAAFGPSPSSPPRPRLERRGHTKSRAGCYHCKRRRIKCQETRPACGHCVKSGLKCEYPSPPQIVQQPSHQAPLFSLQDMRLFQHFLLHCRPQGPAKNESIWTLEVPCLSQKHEHLMHAILGLAASELTEEDPGLAPAAVDHRAKAIRVLRRSLAAAAARRAGAAFADEGNAMMATCLALTLQSVALDDGMAEYMTFIRGVVLVAAQMHARGARFVFSDLAGGGPWPMKARQQPPGGLPPSAGRGWTDAAAGALRGLAPLCRDPLAETYRQMLLDVAAKLRASPAEACRAVSEHHGWWVRLPYDDFQRVVDPASQVFTLLAAHWVALMQIMAAAAETARAGRGVGLGVIRWLRHLNRGVDARHRAYNRWPARVEAQLEGGRGFFG